MQFYFPDLHSLSRSREDDKCNIKSDKLARTQICSMYPTDMQGIVRVAGNTVLQRRDILVDNESQKI